MPPLTSLHGAQRKAEESNEALGGAPLRGESHVHPPRLGFLSRLAANPPFGRRRWRRAVGKSQLGWMIFLPIRLGLGSYSLAGFGAVVFDRQPGRARIDLVRICRGQWCRERTFAVNDFFTNPRKRTARPAGGRGERTPRPQAFVSPATMQSPAPLATHFNAFLSGDCCCRSFGPNLAVRDAAAVRGG